MLRGIFQPKGGKTNVKDDEKRKTPNPSFVQMIVKRFVVDI